MTLAGPYNLVRLADSCENAVYIGAVRGCSIEPDEVSRLSSENAANNGAVLDRSVVLPYQVARLPDNRLRWFIYKQPH